MPLALSLLRLGFFVSLLSFSLLIWSCKNSGSPEGGSSKQPIIENNSSEDPQDHSRLLVQATFGPNELSLSSVRELGTESWIDAQLNMGSAYDSTADN